MAVKKKSVKKKARKNPGGSSARITQRNQDLINALCQVPTPTVKEAAKSLKIDYGVARQMLARPMVLEALEKARAEISKKAMEIASIDAAYVLETSKELVERCMQHKQVFDKDGMPVMVETPGGKFAPAYTFDSGGAARGLKLIGEHIQVSAFKPKDDEGRPIDQNWVVTIVGTDGQKKVVGHSG